MGQEDHLLQQHADAQIPPLPDAYNDDCPICKGPFDDQPTVVTCCRHKFCAKCLDNWYTHSQEPIYLPIRFVEQNNRLHHPSMNNCPLKEKLTTTAARPAKIIGTGINYKLHGPYEMMITFSLELLSLNICISKLIQKNSKYGPCK